MSKYLEQLKKLSKNKKLIYSEKSWAKAIAHIERLENGIEAITKINPPAFSNLSPTRVIAMSPCTLMKHVDELLGKKNE